MNRPKRNEENNRNVIDYYSKNSWNPDSNVIWNVQPVSELRLNHRVEVNRFILSASSMASSPGCSASIKKGVKDTLIKYVSCAKKLIISYFDFQV